MDTMDTAQLKQIWLAEEARAAEEAFDLSALGARMEEENAPWDFQAALRGYLSPEDRLLEIGAGNGDFTLALGHSPTQTAVIENFDTALCEERLAPLGIRVEQMTEDEALPFDDETFDLVFCRNEAFDVREIGRVLRRGGRFVTEQIGGLNNKALSDFLLPETEEFLDSEFTLHSVEEELTGRGFIVEEKQESFPYLRFLDVGAVVLYAAATQWEFPEFEVEDSFPQLLRLQELLEQRGYIESKQHRFLVVARKR